METKTSNGQLISQLSHFYHKAEKKKVFIFSCVCAIVYVLCKEETEQEIKEKSI